MVNYTSKWAHGPVRNTPRFLLYRFAKRLDAGFSFQEIGHVLTGDSGQRTLGNSHLLIKDRGQFIFGPIQPIDNREYEVKNIHDTSHLPFDLRFTPKAIEEVQFQNSQEWISTSIPFPLIIRFGKPEINLFLLA